MNRIIGNRSLTNSPFSPAAARTTYVDLVRARRFDERASALQRRDLLPRWSSYAGREASQVGAARAMADDDWLFPTARSAAFLVARDVPLGDVLQSVYGGSLFESGYDVPVFPRPTASPAQVPQATGAGMAAAFRDADHAILCHLDDDATAGGDFHEGLNFAGVFETPTVFFCENVTSPGSTPRSRQSPSETISQKAIAYGFDGIRVDGNDPLAVRNAVGEALERARKGTPVLVESLTSPNEGTSDDAVDGDEEDALPEWRTRDPVERFEAYLRDQGAIDDEFVESTREGVDEELDEAVARLEAADPPDTDELFESVYRDAPPQLREQRADLRAALESSGERATDD